MKTLLVPTDFSATCRNAMLYAAELARLFKAKLLLFHVHALPAAVSEIPYSMVTTEETQKERETQIKQDAIEVKNAYGVEVEWLVRLGTASDEINLLSQERPVDLIVMGMKGAGGLDKIIGSTTANVIRKVKTPVLIIPHDSSYIPIKHITYASDFSYPANVTLFNPLLELATMFEAKVFILHIYKSEEEAKAAKKASEPAIENVFNNLSHEFVTAAGISVTQGINKYLQDNTSDMLAMVAHKHTFLERVFSKSTTKSMVYETHTPLLVMQG